MYQHLPEAKQLLYLTATLRYLAFVAVFLILGQHSTQAQSLIVGIPSADVTRQRTFEWTQESQFGQKNNKFVWNSFNFLTYGIGKNTEASLSFNNISSPTKFNEALGLGFKHIIPIYHADANHDNKNRHFTEHDIRLTVGAMGGYSLPRKNLGYWVYSHLSYRLPETYTRLTVGVSKGTAPTFGYRNAINAKGEIYELANEPWSIIAGLEQPLSGNWSFIVDWFSGTHDLAAVIPAIQYEFLKQVIIVGYKIPNNIESGNHALVLETMIRF